jgi:hypothetical protein
MRQALHIFAKDTRRCWPFVTASLLLTVALTSFSPHTVTVQAVREARFAVSEQALIFLLTVTWWFTLARLVQGEPPCGDRQFWVTRPYSWISLLVSKALFCGLYLVLPAVVSDCLILSAEGFSWTEHFTGILWRQAFKASLFLLPAVLLAAVTRNMGQFVLGLLGALGYVLLWGRLGHFSETQPVLDVVLNASYLGWRRALDDWGPVCLWVGGGLALVAWQYARRRTALVRVAIAGFGVAGLALAMWQRPTKAIPPTPEHPEFAARFDFQRAPLDRESATGTRNKVQVDLPIEFTGRKREQVEWDLASLCFVPEGGPEWCTPWSYDSRAMSRKEADWMELQLDSGVFARLSQAPVRIRASVAALLYEHRAAHDLRLGSGWTDVPGLGKVMLAFDQRWPVPLLVWRFPLRYPTEKLVFGTDRAGTEPPYWCQYTWHLGTVSDLLRLGDIASVALLRDERTPRGPRLTASSVVHLSLLRRAGHAIRQVEAEGVRLRDYVVSEIR